MKNWIASCIVTMLISLAAVAEDVSVGAAPAAAAACVACHGATGVSTNPEWPNLAGQHGPYLAEQLHAYKIGTRKNTVMAPFAMSLDDAAIAELAAYYAAQPRARAANGDQSLVASGQTLSAYCISCHGMNGVPAAKEWPILSGQHAAYLKSQLLAYKNGERINSHMQAAIARFGEAEFAALAAYYSQVAP